MVREKFIPITFLLHRSAHTCLLVLFVVGELLEGVTFKFYSKLQVKSMQKGANSIQSGTIFTRTDIR